MLPNVKVTVNEEVLTSRSSVNTFLPLVILKTKTGPIGSEVLVKTTKAFESIFGEPDENTPEAFGIYNYIRLYGDAYVVRVASSSAANATGDLEIDSDDILSVSTNYKTDELNGTDVVLVKDGTANKLYLTITVGDKSISSIKETYNASTAKGDDLEAALDKIIESFNAAQNYVTVTNLYVEKTSSDVAPTLSAENKVTLTGGVSGNTSIPDSAVKTIIEKYEGSDLGIDAILAPGFESADVINKLSSVADKSSFMAIASLSGSTATSIITATTGITASASLALYADNVYLSESSTIQVPACIAVLPAYITKNKSSKWLAPAGVTRGTLSDVAKLVHDFGDPELEDLYTNTIPVNGIKKIAGRGYIVWGQKTTSQETTEYQDRINVVRLIKYLTKEVYAISYDYLFEPITDYTYNSWKLEVQAILDDIKMGNGLSDYKVIMDDTLNTEETKRQNKLIGVVRFKPLEAAEFIEINFVVTDDVEGGNE